MEVRRTRETSSLISFGSKVFPHIRVCAPCNMLHCSRVLCISGICKLVPYRCQNKRYRQVWQAGEVLPDAEVDETFSDNDCCCCCHCRSVFDSEGSSCVLLHGHPCSSIWAHRLNTILCTFPNPYREPWKEWLVVAQSRQDSGRSNFHINNN